jgi:hypothetical protein
MVRSPMVAAGIYIDETLQHRGCPLCYLGATVSGQQSALWSNSCETSRTFEPSTSSPLGCAYPVSKRSWKRPHRRANRQAHGVVI